MCRHYGYGFRASLIWKRVYILLENPWDMIVSLIFLRGFCCGPIRYVPPGYGFRTSLVGKSGNIFLEESGKGFGFYKDSVDHKSFSKLFSEISVVDRHFVDFRIKDKLNSDCVETTVFFIRLAMRGLSSRKWGIDRFLQAGL